MHTFEASSVIDAEPSAIWAVLVDGSKWPEWDSAVVRFDGTVAPGEKVTFANGLKDRVEGTA